MEILDTIPEDALREYLKLIETQAQVETRTAAQAKFMPFVHHVYEGFVEGKHHRIIAEKLEKIATGELKRLIINMPPRHSKSELASYLMPAWFLGRNPKLKIIQATHTGELAVRFGRKVRDLINDPLYQRIFPEVKLKEDSQSAGRWETAAKGEYFSAGVGSAVTGRGADLFIIDDPHSEQDALSSTAFDHAYEWYTSGPRQRLQPGGAIIVVMCMTGDTPVLMPDGTEKELRHLRPGDVVATYADGRLETARINNFQSSGFDSIFTIQTRSGRTVRANERHPFLVKTRKGTEWVRLKDLRPGMELVVLKGATGRSGQKPDVETACATRVRLGNPTTKEIPAACRTRRAGGAGGRVSYALLKGVIDRSLRAASVLNTISRSMFLLGHPKVPVALGSSIATISPKSSTKRWFLPKADVARFAGSLHQSTTPVPTGTESCALTTTTSPGVFGDCCATTATLPLGTAKVRKDCCPRQDTSDFTTDEIFCVLPAGVEEVFDVEVDRTENFIANGVVSHNTRWGKKDLTGRLLAAQASDPLADQWEVVELPAILPSGNPIWPEFWKKEDLLAVKASLPPAKWNAQWQQKPSGAGADIIAKDKWRMWEKEKIPPIKYIIQAYDTAFSKKESADYSAITTWGIFEPEDGHKDNIILLDAQRGRWSFPELKEVAFNEHKYWEPDMVIIEAKATGRPLIDELRARGIPAVGFSPGRRAGGGGVDKHLRMHTVSPLFEAGVVWAPADKKFAEEVMEEVSLFPNGDHDDYVDSMTLALMRFRQGGFVTLHEEEEMEEAHVPRAREYY